MDCRNDVRMSKRVGVFSKFIMPPFFGDFRIAGTAGARRVAAGADEAENYMNDPDGEAAEGDGDPELAEGEVKAGKLDAEEVPDTGEQGLPQGGGRFWHAGGLRSFFLVWNGLRDGGIGGDFIINDG